MVHSLFGGGAGLRTLELSLSFRKYGLIFVGTTGIVIVPYLGTPLFKLGVHILALTMKISKQKYTHQRTTYDTRRSLEEKDHVTACDIFLVHEL